MGNVAAKLKLQDNESSKKPPLLSSSSLESNIPQLSSPSKLEEKSIDKPVSKLTSTQLNPGTVDELNTEYKSVMPMCFNGAMIIFQKGLSKHFQIVHQFNLIRNQKNGYKFGTTYVGTKEYQSVSTASAAIQMIQPTESYPIFNGSIDTDGNLNANIIHQLSDKFKCKFIGQFKNQQLSPYKLELEHLGCLSNTSFILANLDLLNDDKSGIFVVQHLHGISKKLAIGCEYVYKFGNEMNFIDSQIQPIAGNTLPNGIDRNLMTLIGKYTCDDNGILTGTIGKYGCNVCYYYRASEQLKFGVEFDVNRKQYSSIGRIGYQINLPNSTFIFRGMIDSHFGVHSSLEKQLHPLPLIFSLNSSINHKRKEFNIGCGIIFG